MNNKAALGSVINRTGNVMHRLEESCESTANWRRQTGRGVRSQLWTMCAGMGSAAPSWHFVQKYYKKASAKQCRRVHLTSSAKKKSTGNPSRAKRGPSPAHGVRITSAAASTHLPRVRAQAGLGEDVVAEAHLGAALKAAKVLRVKPARHGEGKVKRAWLVLARENCVR